VSERDQSQDSSHPAQKKRYRAPLLVEYGSVAKLTEGGQGSMPDNKIMRKKPKMGKD